MKTRRNKYNAKKVKYDGITFDSLAEGKRYLILSNLLKGGIISGLELQPKFKIIIDNAPVKYSNGRIMTYTADFSYIENGERITEDVKGVKTRDYIIKKALVEHIYRIRIRETG